MIAERRLFGLPLSARAIACAVLMACLAQALTIYAPKPPANPAVLKLLDQQLVATRQNDPETMVAGSLFWDYTIKDYRKSTQEDINQIRSFLSHNPELWNYQSYTVAGYTGNFNIWGTYRVDVKLRYEGGTTRTFQFYFLHRDGRWWVSNVNTDWRVASE